MHKNATECMWTEELLLPFVVVSGESGDGVTRGGSASSEGVEV